MESGETTKLNESLTEETYEDITSQLLKRISVFSEDSSILSFERFPSEDTQQFELLEEHREELIEQARHLLYAKQFAFFKSQQLDRNLVVNLMVKGVIFRNFSDDAEKEAKEKYNEMLEQFYNVNQQIEKLNRQTEQVQGEIVGKKTEIQGKLERLQNGEYFQA